MHFYIKYPPMILFTAALHLSWSGLLIFDPTIQFITQLYVIVLPVLTLQIVLVICSVLAIVPLSVRCSKANTMLCFVPQQMLLYLSAIGALLAVANSSYRDGVLHPRLFILADQLPPVMISLFHTRVIVSYVGQIHE